MKACSAHMILEIYMMHMKPRQACTATGAVTRAIISDARWYARRIVNALVHASAINELRRPPPRWQRRLRVHGAAHVAARLGARRRGYRRRSSLCCLYVRLVLPTAPSRFPPDLTIFGSDYNMSFFVFSAEAVGSLPTIPRVVFQHGDIVGPHHPHAADNRFGFEDGHLVRSATTGALYFVVAEMHDAPKWVAMRLGLWRSTDSGWTRLRTLRQSSGATDGDDPHSASWGPLLTHDPSTGSWVLTYVGYRSNSTSGPAGVLSAAPTTWRSRRGGRSVTGWLDNYDGAIYMSRAPLIGDAGLESDFGDSNQWRANDAPLLAPDDFGRWYACQGLQGTDSMAPYQLSDGSWAALVGTAHTQSEWRPSRPRQGAWHVSLATAPHLSGPWTRDHPGGGLPADAPCLNITDGRIENPIVTTMAEGGYLAVFDHQLLEGSAFGVSRSHDGRSWSEAIPVDVPGGCRTPFGLVALTQHEAESYRERLIRFGVTTLDATRDANSTLMWLVYTHGNEDGWERIKSAVVEVPHGFALGAAAPLVRGAVRGRSRRESGRESAARGRVLRPT